MTQANRIDSNIMRGGKVVGKETITRTPDGKFKVERIIVGKWALAEHTMSIVLERLKKEGRTFGELSEEERDAYFIASAKKLKAIIAPNRHERRKAGK